MIFADRADASAKARWLEPELTISAAGLGWDGDAASFREGWIETTPIAVGLSWRPARSVSLGVQLEPELGEITFGNGQKSAPYIGEIYVRYSPDTTHWSSWQLLQPSDPTSRQRRFEGRITVPGVEQKEYMKLLSQYAKLDVPWASDEDAAVRWILRSRPDLFSRHLPFIGYVQLRYEGSFPGGQRVRSLKIELTYVIGGMHTPPKYRDAYRDRHLEPWSLTAEP